MSLIDCLTHIPLNEEERRIYDDLIAQKVAEGLPLEQAQKEAIAARVQELDQDRAQAFDRINEAVRREEGAPAAPVGPVAQVVEPAEAWTEHHAGRAAEAGLTPEQAQAIAPVPDTDPLTGLYTDVELLPAIERARASGEQYTYVESDTFNLGGMNKALGANVRADAVLSQIAGAYEAAFQGEPVFRRGGGRFAAIVPADYDIDAALDQVGTEVARIAEENNLTDIPAPKVAGVTGIGLYSGQEGIVPGEALGDTIGAVQQQINEGMPQEADDGDRSKAFETWIGRNRGRSPAARIAADRTEGRRPAAAIEGAAVYQAIERAGERPTIPEAGETLVSPEQFRQESFGEIASQAGIPPEQAETFSPTTQRDTLTGWFTDRDRKITLARAQQFINDTGGDAAYIVADVSNLGGLNLALGHEAADIAFRSMVEIVHEHAAGIEGAEVIPFRHGGDEVSFVITNATAEATRQAMDQASAEVAGYVQAAGLQDLPHAKDPLDKTRAGSGVYVGVREIGDTETDIDMLMDAADAEVELNKAAPKAEPIPVQLRQERELFQAEIPTETPAFKQWFGDSKVVDEKGEPMIVYHGTGEDFDIFKPRVARAVWFTDDKGYARKYAASRIGGKNRIVSTYIKLENPYIVDMKGDANIPDDLEGVYAFANRLEDVVGVAREQGHDGVIFKNRQKTIEGFSSDEYAVFDSTSIKSVENIGTFDPTDPRILYQAEAAPTFYSNVLQAAASIKQEKATAGQWKSMVAKTPGVKKEEVEWLGLNEWLDEQKGSITKQEVQDFIAANQVQVTEKTLGAKEQTTLENAQQAFIDEFVKEGWDERDAKEATTDAVKDGFTEAQLRQFTPRQKQAIKIIKAAYEARPETVEPTKFETYQLPGGEAYRELLLTLPEKDAPELNQIAHDMYGKRFSELGDEEANKVATEEKRKHKSQTFKSGHYDEPNILAHIRFNERTDADGNKVLFVEEVQSDWHQVGRKKGYGKRGDTELNKKIAELDEELKTIRNDAADMLEELDYLGFDSLSQASRTVLTYSDWAARWDVTDAQQIKQIDAWRDLQIERNGLQHQRENRPEAVPDAPFKTTWPLLAMKRMIRYAAENGFDSIAWTTGEQQAERYDLSKQVESVTWARYGDTDIDLFVTKLDGVAERVGRYELDALPDVIGKELSDKIRGEFEAGEVNGEYSGLDLKIGGEGMKSFYDKMLPSMVNKYVKKWGGKTEMADILAPIYDTMFADAPPLDVPVPVHSLTITPNMAQAAMAGQPLFQETRASIQFTEDNESIIRLTRASDLSSFLHESGHLFLEMESRFAEKFGQTEEQKTLLDWLGVDSFDELNEKNADGSLSDAAKEMHEKFAETFEVYLREGKAPSLKLRDAFAAFARWLTIIYRKLTDSRLTRADLAPEIKEYMDRMLATEVEIEQAMANPAYDQLFRSKEQAGMTDAEWVKYQAQAAKSRNAATVDLNQKLIDELTKRKTREWKEEREPLIDEELERLSQMPVYELLSLSKTAPMDRAMLRDQLGLGPALTTEERYAAAAQVDTAKDSLLIAAAKWGGLNMEEWSREGVDPAYMRDKAFNNRVFGRPIFRKSTGMTADDLAEMANQFGYGQDLSANDVLDLVTRELGGEPIYTSEGYEAQIEAEAIEREGEPVKKPITDVEKLMKRTTAADGVDPAEYAEGFGYTSVHAMIEDMAAAKPLNKTAFDAAEARMVEKYGDMLNDGSIEMEARESVHNEEQAKMLLQEIRALSRGKPTLNREYLKSEAKTLIESMTYKEIKPSKFYRAEIKAAQKAVLAETDADKLAAKTQQLANHYLYKEAIATKETMDRQNKYIKRVQKREYKATEVAPDFSQNMRTLANLYDLRNKPNQIRDVTGILEWYESQMIDENRFVDITLLDPNLILALEAKVRGDLPRLELPTFDQLTASDMRGLYDMLRHMRYVGGQMSDTVKAEMAANRRQLSESILELGGRDVKVVKGIPRRGEKLRRQMQHMINKIPSLRNLMRMLDGFSKDDDGVAAQMIYRTVEAANSHKIDIAKQIYEKFEAEMNDIHKVGLSRAVKEYTLENGRAMPMHAESRYMMALYWGTETSRQAIRDGFGVTDNDVERILSDLTAEQINLVNATWKVNESMWPELSQAHVALYGVAPPKLTPTPFEINGIKMSGGHMRLFYDSTELELKGIQEESRAMSSIMPTKAGSLHARVGSGGRPVLLDKTNITRAIEDNIHYIAFAEPSNKIRALINSKEVRGAIELKHGEGVYRAIIEGIDGITGNHVSRETIPAMAATFRLLRRAATFKHLAYSVRNTVQQVSAIPVAMEEVGYLNWLQHAMRFSSPKGHAEFVSFVNENSKYMRDRASFVNREASEYLRKITVEGEMQHVWNQFARYGFTPQTIVDSIIAYPVWNARYEEGMNSHGDHARAISDADTAVAESVGSGSDIHLGGVFQSNNTEFVKMFTVFGTWFNAYYQRIYRSTEGLTTIANEDAIRTLLFTPFVVAVMSAALIMDLPEDDEGFWEWAMKRYGAFMGGTVPILRDIVGSFSGYAPKTVFSGAAEAPARLTRVAERVIKEGQMETKGISDITKIVTTIVPVPGSGNMTRVMDYVDSYNQGKEGDFDAYQAIVKGSTK